jgi:glutathione S-transferase
VSAPVLWQYNFSIYAEKARWALDYKGVPHRRRSLMPGEPRALAFSRRGTLPVLDIDGERIGDSVDIVAALERRVPEPPLYPADPALRERALELEAVLGERTGHDLRRVAFTALIENPDFVQEFITFQQSAVKRAYVRLGFPLGWRYASRRYDFDPEAVERSWDSLRAMLDRLEAERDGDYLVGDAFSVADLTAASLLFPLAWAPELQYDFPEPPPVERLESLRAHPITAWVGEMYARHRGSSAALD